MVTSDRAPVEPPRPTATPSPLDLPRVDPPLAAPTIAVPVPRYPGNPAGLATGAVGGPPAEPATGQPKRLWMTIAAVLLVGALGLTAGLIWTFAGSSGTSSETTVRLTAANDAGTAPFASSIATVDDATAVSFHPHLDGLATTSDGGDLNRLDLTTVPGDRPGLYGSATTAVCDVTFLAETLGEAQPVVVPWAAAYGIDSADVADVLDQLTPLVIGHDIAVTAYDLDGDRAISHQAILQSGTAVLVDRHGQPRVHCASGSPLSEPTTAGGVVVLDGLAWPAFSSAQVLVVTRTDGLIDALTTTDINTDEPVTEALRGTERGDP